MLTSFGFNLVGWTLSNIVGISADGAIILGDGKNPRGEPSGIAKLK